MARRALGLLGEVPELAPYYDYLLTDKRWAVGALPLPCPEMRDRAFTWVDGSVRYNSRWLGRAGAELEERYKSEAEVVRLAAWRSLPTLVHELSHVMTRRALEEEGIRCWVGVFEDEAAAFYAAARAARAVERLQPAAFEAAASFGNGETDEEATLVVYGRGPAEILKALARTYPRHKPVARTSHQDFQRHLARLLRRSRADIRSAERMADAKTRAVALRAAREQAEADAACLAATKDPAAYARLQVFFQGRYDRAVRGWDPGQGADVRP